MAGFQLSINGRFWVSTEVPINVVGHLVRALVADTAERGVDTGDNGERDAGPSARGTTLRATVPWVEAQETTESVAPAQREAV